jgi:hypothetical protein
VFTLQSGRSRYWWTGRVKESGRLIRSEHRADAIKFPDKATALAVAETHDELRDSDEWKIAPLGSSHAA